jgi:hypothetical protein
MHDEPIERRLRTTLREDAGQLPFTITAAELERRLLLRDRSLGGRRLGLLLAAAVGLGLFGIGGAMGGLFDVPTPTLPAPSPIAEASGPAPTTSPSAPRTLPSLDEMIAARDPGWVVLAQAHTPFDASVGEPAPLTFGDPFVMLGPLPRGEYDIEFACSGGRGGVLLAGPGLPGPVLTRPCDGSIHQDTVGLAAERSLQLELVDTEAWRVVVRRVGGSAVVPGELPATLPDARGRQVLDVVDTLTIPDGRAWPGTGLPFAELGGLPGRLAYEVDVSCVGSQALRYIFGDEIDGELIGVTTTQVPCDGRLHHTLLDLAQPFGSRMYVAAEAGAIVSLMVSGEQPPIELVRELPGWQLSAGAGPDLAFETTQAFTGPGVEGGGPVLIAVSCAGTRTIDVTVRLEHATQPQVTEDTYAQFDAQCEPEGATTTRSFAAADAYVDVEFTAAAGTWVAVSILVPDPLPSPR